MTDSNKDVSWLHRMAALVAVLAFTSITLGKLITSNVALGLTPVPDGPHAFTWSRFSGGVRYELAFRLLAVAGAMLAAAVGAWLARRPGARSAKIVGLATALAAFAHWWFIDIPLSSPQPSWASTFYAAIANTYFGLAVCLAVLTRTDWSWSAKKSADIESPSFRSLLAFTTVATFVASLLGTQTLPSVFLHLLSGCTVTFAALWALEIALNKFPGHATLKIPAILLAELAGAELLLGIVSHSMELNLRASPRPMPGLAVINATHAALAAMLLAASLFATLQAFRYLAPRTARAVSPVPVPVKAEAKAFDPE